MKCGALSVTTVEPCGNDKLSGKKYCATHQAQHEAGTLMAPDEMREKRDALIEGVRQGETVKALRERLGLSQVHASAWIKHSGVRDQMAAEEAERAAAREQAAAEAHAEREAHLGAEREAAEEAAELLRAFRPDYKTPQPIMPGLTPTFAFEPSDLLDLLNELILMRDTVRLLPLHAALATVRHKEVVMLTVAAGEDEAIPCEWGFLETAAAYKEGDAAWIDFPGWGTEVLALAPVASVAQTGS
jgi:hypothetical protein